MKKILALVLLVSASLCGTAQSNFSTTSRSTTYSVTNTNAQQKYLYTSLLGARAATAVVYVGTKSSGYVKGSVALQYLIDTTGFAAGTATWVTFADSLTLANQTTNRKVWPAYSFVRYLRLRITTIDSTQSLVNTGQFISK